MFTTAGNSFDPRSVEKLVEIGSFAPSVPSSMVSSPPSPPTKQGVTIGSTYDPTVEMYPDSPSIRSYVFSLFLG